MAHLSCFLIQPRTTCPRVAPHPLSWLLTSIIIEEKRPTDVPPRQSNGDCSSAEVPPSQIWQKLTSMASPPTYMNILFLPDGSSLLQDKARGRINFDWILTILPSCDRVLDLKCSLNFLISCLLVLWQGLFLAWFRSHVFRIMNNEFQSRWNYGW